MSSKGEFILETERLVIKELTTEDAWLFYKLNNTPKVIEYTGDPPFASLQAAKDFLANYISCYTDFGMGRWMVLRRSDDRPLGWCGLKWHPNEDVADIGFRLLQEFWSKGYATEAAQRCLQYGFGELNLNKIIGSARKENMASHQVLKKLGMKYQFDYEEDNKIWERYQVKKQEH